MQLKITLCRDATIWNEAPFLRFFSPNCRAKKRKKHLESSFFVTLPYPADESINSSKFWKQYGNIYKSLKNTSQT